MMTRIAKMTVSGELFTQRVSGFTGDFFEAVSKGFLLPKDIRVFRVCESPDRIGDVVLLLQGSGLPAECDEGMTTKFVTPTYKHEDAGHGRMVDSLVSLQVV